MLIIDKQFSLPKKSDLRQPFSKPVPRSRVSEWDGHRTRLTAEWVTRIFAGSSKSNRSPYPTVWHQASPPVTWRQPRIASQDDGSHCRFRQLEFARAAYAHVDFSGRFLRKSPALDGDKAIGRGSSMYLKRLKIIIHFGAMLLQLSFLGRRKWLSYGFHVMIAISYADATAFFNLKRLCRFDSTNSRYTHKTFIYSRLACFADWDLVATLTSIAALSSTDLGTGATDAQCADSN